jgi:hypothetical protein
MIRALRFALVLVALAAAGAALTACTTSRHNCGCGQTGQ